ncbi:MAG: hypothetical protein O3C32_06975 [Bacteroidetes bacterium]|nr:hypothetical protein [Bacteroidota bacterium]
MDFLKIRSALMFDYRHLGIISDVVQMGPICDFFFGFEHFQIASSLSGILAAMRRTPFYLDSRILGLILLGTG